MAEIPMEETSITGLFGIRMTCIHSQSQELSLFQITKAAILSVKQVVWMNLAVQGLKFYVIFSVSDPQNFYLLSLKQSPHVNALRTIRKMWNLCVCVRYTNKNLRKNIPESNRN